MTRELLLKPCTIEEARGHAAGRTAITPNDRAAAALEVPGMTLEQLARDRLPALGLAVATPLQAQRALRAAIAAQKFQDPAGAARTLGTTIRELFRAGVDLEALARAGTSRAALLANAARAYRDALRADGLIDGAEALWVAAANPPEPFPLLLYGYPRLGVDDRAFVQAIAGPGSLVLLPYSAHANYQDNARLADELGLSGWQVRREPPAEIGPFSGHAAVAPVRLAHEYPRQEAEVRGALAQIKALLASGVDPGEIVLVARDDAEWGPLVLAVAWEYGVPVRALYAVPLARTRLGSWVAHLGEAIAGDLAFEATYRLLNHPLSPRLAGALRHKARKDHPAGVDGWKDAGADLASLAWPTDATRAQWVSRVEQALRRFEVKKRSATWAAELLAYAKLKAALADLAVPANERLSRASFLRELSDMLQLYTTPAHPGRGGVELHTPLSIYGARYRHVFVLGVAEDHLPARVSNDPMLDFHERKQLAALGFPLEGAAAAARREFLSFGELLSTATEQLVCSYAKLSGDRAAMPSPYFGWLNLTPVAPEGLPLASHEEARRVWLSQQETASDALMGAIAECHAIELRRESASAPDARDPHDGYVGQPIPLDGRTFSATQLSMLGQCPFRWLVEKGWRLKEMPEAEDDLGPSLRGQLYHKALEIGVEWVKDAPDLRSALLERLEEAFAEAERELEIPALPAWPARRAECLQVLRRAIAKPDFLRPGARILRAEADFTGTWKGFEVRGTVDRIDATDAGLVLVDYKAGSGVYGKAKDAQGAAKLDLQLPIYVDVAARDLYPDKAVDGAYYLLLGNGRSEQAQQEPEALEALAERLHGHFASGHFPVAPDKKEEACKYCDHQIMCRKGPRLGRKGAQA